jgi:hypothetical protein
MHCEQNATNKSRTEKEGARRDNNNQSSSSTAFTKSKHAIFSSEPAILFCDLNIDPGGSQTFESTHQIPLLNYPPSFKVSNSKNNSSPADVALLSLNCLFRDIL